MNTMSCNPSPPRAECRFVRRFAPVHVFFTGHDAVTRSSLSRERNVNVKILYFCILGMQAQARHLVCEPETKVHRKVYATCVTHEERNHHARMCTERQQIEAGIKPMPFV